MPFRRTLGAFALAAIVLAGCQKTADKGKTVDGLVEQGFTKDQATCITDDVWDKIPAKERDQLTDPKDELTAEQKTIFFTATVSCARDKVEDELKTGISSAAPNVTDEQVACIFGKLTDDNLVALLNQNTDVLTTAVSGCVSS